MKLPEGWKAADVVITLIVAVIFGGAMFSMFGDAKVTKFVGQPAPQFGVFTYDKKVDGVGETTAGKVVLIDFWATWCPPCKKQMPAVEEIRRAHPDVVVLSVNTDEPAPNRFDLIKNVYDRGGWNPADVLIDDGSVSQLYQIEKLPTLVIIKPDGTVHYASTGVHGKATLEEKLNEASQ